MKTRKKIKICRNKNIIFREANGVVYILDHRNATIHTLNKTASFIWKQIDKPMTMEKIDYLVCEYFEVDKKRASEDVQEFIKKYIKQRFLIEIP